MNQQIYTSNLYILSTFCIFSLESFWSIIFVKNQIMPGIIFILKSKHILEKKFTINHKLMSLLKGVYG